MHNILKFWGLGLMVLALSACGLADQPVPVDLAGEHTCEFRLLGSVQDFDGGTKADGDFVFTNDCRLYVRMTAGESVVYGVAKYSEDTGSWTFSYNGTFGASIGGAAQAVLFVRNYSVQNGGVVMNHRSPVYEDAAASFSIDANGATLSASLSPKTGRISFVHDLQEGDGTWIGTISGISYYSRFNLEDFSFEITENLPSEWISRGEDEYYYGFFTNPEDPYVCYRDNYYYFRHFPASVFQKGQSGYVTRPSQNDTGWMKYQETRSFWLSGINGSSDKYVYMKYVPAGSFMMGAESADDGAEDMRPVHQVTLTHYYIGQAEVTKAEWYNVMGEPADWANNIQPVNYRSYDEIQAFIRTLNEKTGYRFRLPTEAEWEFAARGGVYSRGYRYSGSNNYEDVAQRSDFAVKMKNANELDIFDMSGDVGEFCSDYYGPYSSEAQINPVGPASGSEGHVVRGGWRYSDIPFLTVFDRESETSYNSWGWWGDTIGFRLALDVPLIPE